MDTSQSAPSDRGRDREPDADYGTIVRRLIVLHQQVNALSTLLPPTPAHAKTHQGQGHRLALPSGESQLVSDGGGGRHAGLVIPRLILVGGQSTGKTSLVECLAGVSLPRSQGTCTRGPLDITITTTDTVQDSAWSAEVTLLLPRQRSSPSNHGGPIKFGHTITDPGLVADRLRRATLAVRDLDNLPVAPSAIVGNTLTTSRYQSMSIEEIEDMEEDSALPTFFPAGARLSLDIRAPGAQPLRFTDLPGLISEGTSIDRNAIRNMVSRDISDPNVIIVLAASLAMDIAHQSAFSLVKSVDPNGERTIGVLTMPDRMPSGAERLWAKVISESMPSSSAKSSNNAGATRKYFIKHGWHVVRCPAQHEDPCNISIVEDTFFHGSDTGQVLSPWHRTVSLLSVDNDSNNDFVNTRCGLGNLYRHMSRLLLLQLQASLPGVMTDVGKLKQDLLAKLEDADGNGFATGILSDGWPQSLLLQTPHTYPVTHTDNAGFNTLRELYRVIDTIANFLVYSSVEVSNLLVPRLAQELVALAPVHHPFSAEEARNKGVLAVYRPRQWSFQYELAKTVALLPNKPDDINNGGDPDLDNERNVAPAPVTTAQRYPPKKKAVTIDQLIAELFCDSKVDPYLAPGLHLGNTHAVLQHKISLLVHTYTAFCRTHLSSLLKKGIPKAFREKYDHLCSDVLIIADRFVQLRLASDMQRLAARIADQPFNWRAGSTLSDDNLNQDVAVGTNNEFSTWIDDEMQAYLTIRMSLIARERAELGDKHFVADIEKVIALHDKHGMVNHTRLIGKTDATAVEGGAGVPRKGRKAAALARIPSPTSPSPSPDRGSNVLQSPDTPTPSRHPANTIPAASTSSSSIRGSSKASSSPPSKLHIYPQLVHDADTLVGNRPFLYIALNHMAHLRGDFNFFSLLVARECQQVPVRIMGELQSYLRETLAEALNDHGKLDEADLYKRYFYDADRPRREKVEYLAELRRAVDTVNATMKELEEIKEQVAKVVAKEGGGWGNTRDRTERRAHQNNAVMSTPVRSKTSTGLKLKKKASPRTPTTSSASAPSSMFAALNTISPGSKASPSTTIRSSIGYAKERVTPQKRPREIHDEQPTPTRARLPPATFGDSEAQSTSDEQHRVSSNSGDGDDDGDGDGDGNLFFGYDLYEYDEDAPGSPYPDDQQLQGEESDEQSPFEVIDIRSSDAEEAA